MNEQKQIDLSHIEPLCVLRLLGQKLWLIVLAALTAAMAAAAFLTVVPQQTYSTGVTFAVLSRAYGASGYASVSVATEVAEIYSELLSGSYMSQIIDETVGDVSGEVTAQQLGETNLIEVRVTSDNPRDALTIIQLIVEKQSGLSEYVSSTAVLTPIDSLSITVTSGAYAPARTILLAALGGSVIMAAIVAMFCVLGRTVQTRRGAKDELDGRLLTTIAHEARPGRKRQAVGTPLISDPLVSFGFAEAIYRLCALLEHENAKGSRVFLLTSTCEGEGKSTVTANLALAMGKRSARVLLVDMDLHRPVQHRILGETVPPQSDLGRLLAAGASPETILSRAISRPGSELELLLAALPDPAAARLADATGFAALIELARERYDYILLDTPPLSYFSDSQRISDLADASVLIVRQDTVPAPEINDAIDELREGRSEFLGYVLNDMQHLLHRSEYGYAGSTHYGSYGKYGRYGKYARSHAHTSDADDAPVQ